MCVCVCRLHSENDDVIYKAPHEDVYLHFGEFDWPEFGAKTKAGCMFFNTKSHGTLCSFLPSILKLEDLFEDLLKGEKQWCTPSLRYFGMKKITEAQEIQSNEENESDCNESEDKKR